MLDLDKGWGPEGRAGGEGDGDGVVDRGLVDTGATKGGEVFLIMNLGAEAGAGDAVGTPCRRREREEKKRKGGGVERRERRESPSGRRKPKEGWTDQGVLHCWLPKQPASKSAIQ